jgi:hypothetical protein
MARFPVLLVFTLLLTVYRKRSIFAAILRAWD